MKKICTQCEILYFDQLKGFLQRFHKHINDNNIKHYKYEKKFFKVITN